MHDLPPCAARLAHSGRGLTTAAGLHTENLGSSSVRSDSRANKRTAYLNSVTAAECLRAVWLRKATDSQELTTPGTTFKGDANEEDVFIKP